MAPTAVGEALDVLEDRVCEFDPRAPPSLVHVISTKDFYREIAMRPRIDKERGQRVELAQFFGAVLTGAPMPIPVGPPVATPGRRSQWARAC